MEELVRTLKEIVVERLSILGGHSSLLHFTLSDTETFVSFWSVPNQASASDGVKIHPPNLYAVERDKTRAY